MKRIVLIALVSGIGAGADAATLRMNFAGGGTEVTLGPIEAVEIEVWLDLAAGESVVGVLADDEPAPGLTQIGVSTRLPGWTDLSANGALGVSVGNLDNQSPIGAGSHLVATQTVQLDSDAVDGDIEIVFLREGNYPTITSEDGSSLSVSFGDGSPGTGPQQEGRTPLIVHATTDGGGDGTVPDGAGDADGDGVPDDQDTFPDDPDETTDTDDDGIGDNADTDDDNDGVGDDTDAFPDDPDETTDTDDDGVGDNTDTDDDDDGVADTVDLDPLDPTVGRDGDDSSGGRGDARGPSG